MSEWLKPFLFVAIIMAVKTIVAKIRDYSQREKMHKSYVKSSVQPSVKPAAELTPEEMLSIIREEGFCPHLDDDGDVVFKINGISYVFGIHAKGIVYGRLIFRQVRENKWPAMLAARQVELSYYAIQVLVIPENESLVFSVESLCCETGEAFRAFFSRALSILRDSANMFFSEFQKYKDSEECKERMLQEALVPPAETSLKKEDSWN